MHELIAREITLAFILWLSNNSKEVLAGKDVRIVYFLLGFRRKDGGFSAQNVGFSISFSIGHTLWRVIVNEKSIL